MRELSYRDITLVPNYSTLNSRSLANTNIFFGNRELKVPVIPANMRCTINTELAYKLSQNNYGYIMHRFDGKTNKKDLRFFISKANKENWNLISISIGVQEEDYKLVEWINRNKQRIDWLCIDLAHGHCLRMKILLHYLNAEILPERKPFIIAGNVATKEAVRDLHNWGADAVKVFIGPGLACQTYNKTGFGSIGTFSTALNCSFHSPCPLIFDGGIRENGDITKALVAGMSRNDQYSIVMAGSLFVSCIDSPAESVYEAEIPIYKLGQEEPVYISKSGKIVAKKYYGSASLENGNTKNIEGKLIEVCCNEMNYEEKLNEIKEDLQSSLSYAGAKNLEGLRYVKWCEI